MKSLLEKLNYKGQTRIAVINAGKNYSLASLKAMKGIQIDTEVDQRFPRYPVPPAITWHFDTTDRGWFVPGLV